MKYNKKFILIFVAILVLSFGINLFIENKLYDTISQIKLKNLSNLDQTNNRNFQNKGIENIGKSLQFDLINMDIGKCRFEVKKDFLFFFQEKKIYIINDTKSLEVNCKYDFTKSIFKIKNFETVHR